MTVVTNTIRNGADTEKMFATLDLIKDQPELAKFHDLRDRVQAVILAYEAGLVTPGDRATREQTPSATPHYACIPAPSRSSLDRG
jgi:hypothetical protein